MTGRRPALSPVHGLFQKRIDGDDALLELARLRFAQAGLGAEVYAGTPDELDWILKYVPPHQTPPVVHLSRTMNLMREADRQLMIEYGRRFAGRIRGLVIHDRREQYADLEALTAAAEEIESVFSNITGEPCLFIEYAAGIDLDLFAEMMLMMRGVKHVSACIDIGHVGIRQTWDTFRLRRAGADVCSLRPWDPLLREVVEDVQDAVASALPALLGLITALGPLGKPLHFHMHDAHPLRDGVPDHASFLTLIAIPFEHGGRRSLPPLFGPEGLSRIVAHAVESCGPDQVSFTLEIHEQGGRLPLDDAASLFAHWRDTTNAERMNQWLAVLAQNCVVLRWALQSVGR
jgi:hypothetical protein